MEAKEAMLLAKFAALRQAQDKLEKEQKGTIADTVSGGDRVANDIERILLAHEQRLGYDIPPQIKATILDKECMAITLAFTEEMFNFRRHARPSQDELIRNAARVIRRARKMQRVRRVRL